MVNAYGAFLGLYDEHLLTKHSDLQLSLVGATESFLLLFPSIFAGRLLDARRHYYLGFTGFLLLFLGYFSLSFAGGNGGKDQGNYGLVWLTSGLLAGLGMTCFFTYSSHNGKCLIQWLSIELPLLIQAFSYPGMSTAMFPLHLDCQLTPLRMGIGFSFWSSEADSA